MQFIRNAALALGLIAGMSAPAMSETTTSTVTKDFSTYMWVWDNRGDMMIAWSASPINGTIQICGVFSPRGRHRTKLNRQVLREMKFKMDDKTIFKDASYFATVLTETRDVEHRGETATCKDTGVAVPKGGYTVTLVPRLGHYSVAR